MENILTIGSGKMGSLLAGNEAVSIRQTESFDSLLDNHDVVMLTTRQDVGLNWLRENSRSLSNKVVVSLMVFVNFEALEKATNNNEARFVRIMIDTSLKNISWSDDGKLSNYQKELIEKQLSKKGSLDYLGVRADEKLLLETIKACQLGWVAQALAELSSKVDQTVLNKVLDQRNSGQSFSDIYKNVATPGGATEAGINATSGEFGEAFSVIFEKQILVGLKKATEKSETFTNYASSLI